MRSLSNHRLKRPAAWIDEAAGPVTTTSCSSRSYSGRQRRTDRRQTVPWSTLFLLYTAIEHEDVQPFPTLGGDVRVNGDDLGSSVLLDNPLQDRAPGFQDLLAHGLDDPAPTTKAGAAPRLYTIRGDAVTGPGSADRPERIPEETAQI